MTARPATGGAARAWADWKAHARMIAHYQLAMFLSVAYVMFLGPIWLIGAIVRRDLMPYRGELASTWLPRRVDPRSLDDLKRPY